ncbi:hypothetical protein [Novosphingobium sp. ZW T3_23]|uniref:hypothetical protein n=1 Tax=Novosphingobium sp. ZW T3_23 TaxID=3378084 RepID=UPI003854FF8E
MTDKPTQQRGPFSAFSLASEETKRFGEDSPFKELFPVDRGDHGANAIPREVTTLERRVLAHERILQALISDLAEDDPAIFKRLNSRFGAGHDLGTHEQDYVTTDHYCEHFLHCIEQQIAARQSKSAKLDLSSGLNVVVPKRDLEKRQIPSDRGQCEDWENEGGSFILPLTPPRTAYFQIARAESVMLTSTRIAGGDWRWQLRSTAGILIAKGSGFRTETECLAVVKILKNSCQDARILID